MTPPARSSSRVTAAGAISSRLAARDGGIERGADMAVLGDMAQRCRRPLPAASKCSEKGEAGASGLPSVTRISRIGWAWASRCGQTPSAVSIRTEA